MAEALALARVQAEEERERAIDAAIAKYLASEAFQVVKVRCYLDSFKGFRKLAIETFPNLDFTAFDPEEEEGEGKGEAEKGVDGIEVVSLGAIGVDAPGAGNPLCKCTFSPFFM